jgi:hypothetical protein
LTTSSWVTTKGFRDRVWIVPEFKIVFVAVAKNACTSIKRVIAELGRENLDKFKPGLKAYTDDGSAVHMRSLYRKIPSPDKLDPEIAAQIHPDNGWFIFGIVRDPWSRLFSAWQDKMLLQYPAYRWAETKPWYPRFPESTEQINADFARFVDAAVADRKFPLLTNTHFRLQSLTLDHEIVPFSHIYPIGKLDELRDDLAAHVEPLGWQAPIAFQRTNDTPLKANGAVFAGDVRAKVESWYAADFAQFGEYFDFARIEAVPEWTAAQLREVQLRAASTRRLGDVRKIALDYQKRAKEAKARADAATKRADELTRQLAGKKTVTPASAADSAHPQLRKAIRQARRAAGRVKRRIVARRQANRPKVGS